MLSRIQLQGVSSTEEKTDGETTDKVLVQCLFSPLLIGVSLSVWGLSADIGVPKPRGVGALEQLLLPNNLYGLWKRKCKRSGEFPPHKGEEYQAMVMAPAGL